MLDEKNELAEDGELCPDAGELWPVGLDDPPVEGVDHPDCD